MENYENVQLTEEEVAEALTKAREAKIAKIKLEEYTKRVKGEVTCRKYTSNELYETISKMFKMEVDDYNSGIIRDLCKYFTQEEGVLDLSKGIILAGPVGCGKTTLMEIFRFNQSNSFMIISANDLTEMYVNDGFESIERYKHPIKTSSIELSFGQEFIGLCIDDLGTENDGKNYGNQVNVVQDIILKRYTSLGKNVYNKTHFTTNLSVEEIESKYGERFRSRLRQMCNFVTFNVKSPDRRK